MQLKISNEGTEPVTSDEVKLYCKIDYDVDDTLITSLITSCRQRIERFTGLALVSKTIEYFEDDLSENEFELPYPEHDEIQEVKLNGVATTDYVKTGLSAFILSLTVKTNTSTEPTTDRGLYIKYTTTGNCEEGIKNEILRLINEYYEHRGNTFEGSITELTENSYCNLMQYVVI